MYYSDQVILYFVCLILFISGQNAATRSIFNQDSEIQLLGKGIMRKNGQASLKIQVEIGPAGGQGGWGGAEEFPPVGARPPGIGRRPGVAGRRPGPGRRRPRFGRRPGFGGRGPGAGAGGPGAEEEGPGTEEEGPGGPGAGIGGPETGGACVTFLIVFWAFTN